MLAPKPDGIVAVMIYQIICIDRDAMHWPEEDIGSLRVALNALVRLFRL